MSRIYQNRRGNDRPQSIPGPNLAKQVIHVEGKLVGGGRNGMPIAMYLPKDPGRRERLLAGLRMLHEQSTAK